MKRTFLTIVALSMLGATSASNALADDDDKRYRGYPPPGYQLPLRGRVEFYIGPRGDIYIDGSATPFRQYYGQPQAYPLPNMPYVFDGPGYAPYPYPQVPGNGYLRYGRPNYYEYGRPSGYRNYKYWRHYGDDDDDDDD